MKNGFSTKAIADLTVCIAHLEEAMAGISVNIIIQYREKSNIMTEK